MSDPDGRVPKRRGRGRRGHERFVVVAVAAILAVMVAVTVAVGTTGQKSTPRSSPAPRFIVASSLGHAEIRNATTGQFIGAIPAPGRDVSYIGAVAAADNRTYFLKALAPASPAGVAAKLQVYRVTLDESGRPSAPVAVRGGSAKVPAYGGGGGGFAVSPDSSRIAIADYTSDSNPESGPATTFLMILDVSTGDRDTWKAPRNAQLTDLSWAADNRTLLFNASIEAGRGGYRILDVQSRGSDPIKASRQVSFRGPLIRKTPTVAVLSADGRTVYAVESVQPNTTASVRDGNAWPDLVVVEVSVADGRELRTRARWPEMPWKSAPPKVTDGKFLILEGHGQYVLTIRQQKLTRIHLGTGAAHPIPMPLDSDSPQPFAW